MIHFSVGWKGGKKSIGFASVWNTFEFAESDSVMLHAKMLPFSLWVHSGGCRFNVIVLLLIEAGC